MPSKEALEEQIYEAMRVGSTVPFEFSVGGVKYKAVFQHKDACDARMGISRTNIGGTVTSTSSSVSSMSKESKH